MAMDFFEHQQQARRRTGLLVTLFVAAVLAIIAVTYLAVAGILTTIQHQQSMMRDAISDRPVTPEFGSPMLLAAVGCSVVAVVLCGSLYKLAQLRDGGHVIADALGARLITPDSTDPHEQQLHNVVEEMAIASGMPVPPVYVMDDERGINAFAAGYLPGDAIVCVTHACMTRLTRDELQGVIAHEFSHILNGDMQTNIRLMGVIHGILIIGLIGMALLRSLRHVRVGGRGKDKGGGGILIAMLAIGVALLVIGYVGVFFANLIKAAVSRQREFLADASAVQFTRNPAGIAGALNKIDHSGKGAMIDHPHAAEASHMFFGEALMVGWFGLTATHPPIKARIHRIDPDGLYVQTERARKPERTGSAGNGLAGALRAVSVSDGPPANDVDGASRKAVAHASGSFGQHELPGAVAHASGSSCMRSAMEEVGQVSAEHIGQAAALVASMPAAVRQAAHEPYGAMAVVFGLLLSPVAEVRRKQLDALKQTVESGVYALTFRLVSAMPQRQTPACLALLEMAAGSLRNLTSKQYQAFRAAVLTLIHADDKVELFEWMLQRLVVTQLDRLFLRGPTVSRLRLGLQAPAMTSAASVMLSMTAYAGTTQTAAARSAFDAGNARLVPVKLDLLPLEQCRLPNLDQAMASLEQLTLEGKKKLLSALAATIAADRQVTAMEAELFRGIAAGLDCPVPLMLSGQTLI
ncbi:MAG: M48 family metallopeptidase [Phycisphaeraceae bacterium]|nr:M48 family metallopeptidase [Phycisphaeraceae bacterium]